MSEQQLAETGDDWRTQVSELQALLAEIRPRLIDAEAKLADRFAEISAFEFHLRSQIEPLVRRLESIKDDIRELRRQLRQLQEDWFFAREHGPDADLHIADWDFAVNAGAAAEGDYRYMGPRVKPPPADLTADKQQKIKRLYRQLARRFHPDLAQNRAERQYRTDIMMRINAAYTAGDLEKLEALAAEPDSPDLIETALTDQLLAEALLRELSRCRRRLAEIEAEFTTLGQHRNAKLWRRVQKAADQGQDLLVDMAWEVNDEIGHLLVERDILRQEIESFSLEQADVSPDSLADTILDLGLEQVFDENDNFIAAKDWHRRHGGRYKDLDDILDDAE